MNPDNPNFRTLEEVEARYEKVVQENAKLKDKISLLEQHLESSRRDRTILQDAANQEITKLKAQLSDAVKALEEIASLDTTEDHMLHVSVTAVETLANLRGEG